MNAKVILLVGLAAFTLFYVWTWYSSVRAGRLPKGDQKGAPNLLQLATGFVTNFFDTLGIGSFAPTTSLYKFTRMVPDERIPGTLNVGHTLPTITQAFIFTVLVQVDFLTLVLLIAAAVLGAVMGAGVVARWPRRNIQVGMGFALLVAALLFSMTILRDQGLVNMFPPGGDALGLTGGKLVLGIAGNFLLGALMTLGIGLYAPCMILISLLGMSPTTAFPIMMGSCAFLMPVGSARFIHAGKYSFKPALGLALGGIPAVLIAAFIVKSLPLTYVRGLVVLVVLYAAITMLRSAMVPAPTAQPQAGD